MGELFNTIAWIPKLNVDIDKIIIMKNNNSSEIEIGFEKDGLFNSIISQGRFGKTDKSSEQQAFQIETDALCEKLKEICLRHSIIFKNVFVYDDNDPPIVVDKYDIKIDIPNEALLYVMKSWTEQTKLIQLKIYENECKWKVLRVKLLDYTGTLGKIFEILNNVEKILDMPGNMGSIEGWLAICKENVVE